MKGTLPRCQSVPHFHSHELLPTVTEPEKLRATCRLQTCTSVGVWPTHTVVSINFLLAWVMNDCWLRRAEVVDAFAYWHPVPAWAPRQGDPQPLQDYTHDGRGSLQGRLLPGMCWQCKRRPALPGQSTAPVATGPCEQSHHCPGSSNSNSDLRKQNGLNQRGSISCSDYNHTPNSA